MWLVCKPMAAPWATPGGGGKGAVLRQHKAAVHMLPSHAALPYPCVGRGGGSCMGRIRQRGQTSPPHQFHVLLSLIVADIMALD